MNRAINFNSISTVVFFMEFKKAGSFLSSKIRIFSIKVFFVASLAHKGCLFAPACIAAGFAVPYCLFFLDWGPSSVSVLLLIRVCCGDGATETIPFRTECRARQSVCNFAAAAAAKRFGRRRLVF